MFLDTLNNHFYHCLFLLSQFNYFKNIVIFKCAFKSSIITIESDFALTTQTHSKVEAWGCLSATGKICFNWDC